MKCKGCAAENPAGLRFCGSCGRSLVSAPASSTPAAARPGTILAGVVILGLVVLAALAVIGSHGSPSSSSAPAAEFPKRRMFCENHRPDDPTREGAFKLILRKTGERCDSVETALLSPASCNWVVRCAPGYSYSFEFNAEGDIQGLQRIR